jgi:hypothetical protein
MARVARVARGAEVSVSQMDDEQINDKVRLLRSMLEWEAEVLNVEGDGKPAVAWAMARARWGVRKVRMLVPPCIHLPPLVFSSFTRAPAQRRSFESLQVKFSHCTFGGNRSSTFDHTVSLWIYTERQRCPPPGGGARPSPTAARGAAGELPG